MRPTLAVLIPLAVLGCGGKSERLVAQRCGPDRDLSEVDARVERALCERATRCGVYSDPESCLETEYFDAHLLRDGESGCVVYHPERVDACIARLEGGDCTWTDLVRALEDDCAAPFEGTLLVGEACATDWECESRACVTPPCFEACCTRTCAGRDAPVGAACQYHQDCIEGAFCADGTCEVVRRAGEPCHRDGAITCEESFWCLSGICSIPPREGDPCGGTAFFFSCDDVRDHCDDATKKCVRAAPVGGSCSPEGPACIAETSCRDDVCVPLPGAGAPCDDGDCRGDLLCSTNDRCVPPEPEPEPTEPSVMVCLP